MTGVPDTLLNDFCLGLDEFWPDKKHVIAANEGNAIALAAGYHLATGTVPLVYMQNSGIGNALNPLISLVDRAVYGIPMVLLIGWRGEPGSADWPQHRRQGELTPILLDVLKIPHRVLNADDVEMDIAEWAAMTARDSNCPAAVLVKKGVLALTEKADFAAQDQSYPLSREDAISRVLSCAPQNSIFVATTGRAARELYALREARRESHQQDFLNVGAMGHALSIAAGIATARRDRPVICLDGDAAAIMHLGSVPVAAAIGLSNLLHVVLNNGAHESVGGQPTIAFNADLNTIAAASGFATIGRAAYSGPELESSVQDLLNVGKPAFLEIRIRKGMRKDMPVLKMNTQKTKACFVQWLASFSSHSDG